MHFLFGAQITDELHGIIGQCLDLAQDTVNTEGELKVLLLFLFQLKHLQKHKKKLVTVKIYLESLQIKYNQTIKVK